jgi:hypothetical protein
MVAVGSAAGSVVAGTADSVAADAVDPPREDAVDSAAVATSMGIVAVASSDTKTSAAATSPTEGTSTFAVAGRESSSIRTTRTIPAISTILLDDPYCDGDLRYHHPRYCYEVPGE